jgi:peptidoglycan hydrolase CwlO-like protein
MTNEVTHDEIAIDLDDPQATLKALKRIEFKLGTGQSVVRAKVGDDDVEYTAANMKWLQGKIKELENTIGRNSGRCRRFAAQVNFR